MNDIASIDYIDVFSYIFLSKDIVADVFNNDEKSF
jgi:hypothetical protein